MSSEASTGSSENKDFKAELAHFEQLLGSLAAIKKPFTFEVAVPHVGEEICFYLAVPKLSSHPSPNSSKIPEAKRCPSQKGLLLGRKRPR